ncbi:hypothetical protein SFC08_02795 [Lysinibacillus halotolerans]|uniref:Integrase n=1 Tax=Ureibacillus galli TaxID=2762222 RepID=A0ABR8XAG2_9BACL|nr:hypothetical protein [Ureibacillus galli]MBD8026313.1 hypothetical protein [Ureibacillus galli]
MSKRRNGLIKADLTERFNLEEYVNPNVVNPKASLSIEKAIEISVRQMRASGLRERTIHDYETFVNDFVRKTNVEYLLAIGVGAIYGSR